MAYLYRPVAVKPVPKSATAGTHGGKRVARWTARGGKPVVAELTADGKKCRVRSPTWWVEYTDHAGTRRHARGFKTREATLQLAAQLERTADAVRAGIETDSPSRERLHLVDLLAGYKEYIEGRSLNPTHTYESVEYVRQIVTGAALTTPAAVDCGRLQSWLEREAARIGDGKKKKWSARTFNHRVVKLRAFGNWMVKHRQVPRNPFVGLMRKNAEDDRKHVRRALDHPELLRLVAAARASRRVVYELTGTDRAALYLIASYTGFRARGLASLTPGSFEWQDGIPVFANLSAKASKNKKPHRVPLHLEVGRDLAVWLASRPAGRTLFPRTVWAMQGAKMLRGDLAEARAAYIAEAGADAAERARRKASDVLEYEDAAGEVFDFHALRVQFISGLARSGVSQMAATALAAHSDPRLTSVVYARWGKGDALAAEVAKLPGLKPPG